MSKFIDFLLSLDYFALSPGLYFNGKRKFRTAFGVCLTLFSAAVFLHIFIIFSLNMVTKSNPQIIFSEKHYRVPPKTQIDFRNFSLAIAFSTISPTGQVEQIAYDPTVFYPVFYELRYTRVNGDDENFKYSVETFLVNMNPCNKEDFNYDNQLFTYIKRVNSSNVICVDLEQKVNLEGQPGEDFYTMLSMDVMPCRNLTVMMNNK